MNSITGIIKMHVRSRRVWFFVPWIVLLSSFTITLLIGHLFAEGRAFYTGGLSSIYIFTFILAPVALADTFPFALNFGVRRTDYFLGTVLLFFMTSVATGLILLLCSLLENSVTVGWGIGLHFFYLPYISNGSLIEQFGVYLIALLHMYFLGFAIGCVYLRFGKTGMWIFSLFAFLLVSIFTYLRWWGTLYNWLGQHSAFELAMWIVPLIIVYALVAYALLRKATV